MAREGIPTVLLFLAGALLFTFLTLWTSVWVLGIVAIIFWGLTLFLTYFFRDPERTPPVSKNLILSPADGRIVSIEEVTESYFLHGTVTKISIFMSPLNVHINRIPISGRVAFYRYKKGKFLAAYKPEASAENEQTIIGIRDGEFKLLFKQIAGVLARRIVCNLEEEDTVRQGEKFGLIKLGSRVDVFLPASVNVRIKLNQNVIAGESILGEIQYGLEKQS